MATRGKGCRAKGHKFEIDVRNFFIKHGYSNCVSSRSESKRADDEGRDLVYTDPFYVQCKAVENLGSLHKVLAAMPQDCPQYNLVFHKRSRAGVTVSMTLEDFDELLGAMIANGIINPK